MIILRTGVPGSGKTLSMVQALAQLIDRWKTHPDEVRPIFVLGIPDLSLVHSVLPTKSVLIGRGVAPQIVPDLDAIPDGSLVVIDEAQGCYPPRSSAMAPPDHVAELNTHRHRGLDMWLTTQHPKLIDHSVRALVGKHMHYRRLFGGRRAMVYEWDACSDSLSGMKSAVVSYWSYPKKVFNWYKSAEIHTKQKFKLPAFVWLPLISLVICAYSFPKAYDALVHGKPKKVPAPLTTPSKTSVSASVDASIADVGKLPDTPVETRPDYVGCVANEKKCTCVTSAGVTLANPPMCRESAGGFGYLVKVAMSGGSVSAANPVPLPAVPDSVKSKPPTAVAVLSRDGFGILGASPQGVRQPGQ